MKYGIYVPNYGEYSDPRRIVQLARDAEKSGWEGFFFWDNLVFDRRSSPPLADAWIVLAAVAASTERLTLGPLITPIARRRPWKVAREAVSLDHLSRGRAILGVGLGSPPGAEFAAVGEEASDKVRAEKLDEGLEIISRLWSGERVNFAGKHFKIDGVKFRPQAFENRRIPIWVAGMLPNKAPFRRAAKWNGVFPLKNPAAGAAFTSDQLWLAPAQLREVVDFIRSVRPEADAFDVVAAGATPGDDRGKASDMAAFFAESGATWWLEWLDDRRGTFEEMRTRILCGPPRAESA